MASFTRYLLVGFPVVLALWAYRYNQHLEKQPQDWKVTANRIELSDGRHIAYEVVGSRDSSNAIMWFHGLASSRWFAPPLAHAVHSALSSMLTVLRSATIAI